MIPTTKGSVRIKSGGVFKVSCPSHMLKSVSSYYFGSFKTLLRLYPPPSASALGAVLEQLREVWSMKEITV